MINFTLLYRRERTRVLNEYEAGWTPEPVSKVWRHEKILTPAEIRTSDPPARNLNGLPTTLLRFPTVRNKTDGMSDIHSIYCRGVPTQSPRASFQSLSSLCNAPQESSCSSRIRTRDSRVRSSKTFECSTT